MNIPKNVLHILNTLEGNGYEAYIVGGCVRDYMLNIEPTDFDITTNALPDEVKSIFQYTVDTGIEHGTISVILDKKPYEVTTYRIDGEYKNNRKPETVEFTKDLIKDLSRRDFTSNAIAYNEKDGFIDPFGGKTDIKNKIIKGVGIADKRFKEDALRMIRGVRFCAKLGFDIEKDTLIAINDNAHLLKNISMERIRDEFFKILRSKYIEKIELLYTTNLYKYFMPELLPFFLNIYKNIDILKNIEPSLRFIYVLYTMKDDDRERVSSYFDIGSRAKNEIKTVLFYIDYNFLEDRIETKRLMSKISENLLKNALSIKFAINLCNNNLIKCKKCDNIYDEINDAIRKDHPYSIKHLDITGNDIKSLNIKNGKEIGRLLNICLEHVIINHTENKKDILISICKKNIY